MLVHNQTPNLFCGIPVNADVASGLVDLNRRLGDAGDAESVGAALSRLGDDLGDELAEQGVDRILNVILDVERRGETGLAGLMARNLAGDSRATAGIARRELELQAAGSANAGVYSEKVLGDEAYAGVWQGGVDEDTRDLVLIRIDDSDFFSASGDVFNNAERSIRDTLRSSGRSVDNNPLEALDDVPRADALVEGVETDFKTLFGGSQDALLRNIEDSLEARQGPALVVDADGFSSFNFDRNQTRSAIQSLFDEADVDIQLQRLDVILSDGSLLTWIDGAFI